MKIAVTGATGFVGRQVLAELKARRIKTIAVIRPSTTNLIQSLAHKTVQIDIHNPPANALEVMGFPDALIHMAWSGLPNYKSLHHFETELPLQYLFLKNLIGDGLKNLVVTGTCLEYGNQSGKLSELSNTPKPETTYGYAKNALREQLEYLKEDKPYLLTWARLFYLYGEGQAKNSLFPQLQRAVARGDKKFNMSGGEQLRDYLSVGEAARHLVSLALKEQDTGVINICSGIPISVRHLVENWISEHEWEININLGHYPYSDYEPMAFWGDAGKLLQTLGEQP